MVAHLRKNLSIGPNQYVISSVIYSEFADWKTPHPTLPFQGKVATTIVTKVKRTI